MRRFLVASLVVCSAVVRAQSPAAITGHWEGSLAARNMDVAFQIDVAKDGRGELIGTITVPSQHLTGLPLIKIVLDGHNVTLSARSDQLMTATLNADGTLSGDYSTGDMTAPFALKRTGDATIAPAPRSAPVAADLEGRWSGSLAGQHLELTLANDGGGAIATLISVDEGGLTIPLVIARDGATVTLTSAAIGATWTGSLTADGSLAGTFTENQQSAPLTFTRRR